MKHILYLGFFLFAINVGYSQEAETTYLSFIQEGNTQTIKKNVGTVLLKRQAFSIRFFGKAYESDKNLFHSTRIAVLDDPKDTIGLEIGQSTENTPYFQPGTGMAPGANGQYDVLFIGSIGHHYLYYENEEDKRARLISKKDGMLELQWDISAAFYDGGDIQFSELHLSDLYFVIFSDSNLNGIIDANELKIVKAIFR